MSSDNKDRAMHRKLNVGVVGIGRMGQKHALNILHSVPRATLLCACSPAEADLAWGNEYLKPYNVRVVATFEDLIDTPGLDAVIVASSTELHARHTTAALDRNIHVLCEKPVCKTVEELVRLVKRTEANPRAKLMVGFVRRFDQNYQDALEKVKAGAIGRPIIIRSQGCEKLDTKDSKPKSVFAAGVAAVHTKRVEEGDADNAVGICEFWDGKIAYFYNSRTAAHGYDNATEIFGTAGKISINMVPRKNTVELCDGDGFVKAQPTPGWYDRYAPAFVEEAKAWVDALLDDKPMPIPLGSSLRSLEIATALQESLRTGNKIFFTREGAIRREIASL
uniref:Gfo/Idh/MocA-like oxidoreductase N-terminal domain-containing protein n=1 Tax=Bionectria ochroleuca TaxID=29856 RepID=A0A8H7NMA4_BIOOC